MKKLMLMLACLIFLSFASQSVTAQITIRLPEIPKLPKIKKSKSEQPQNDQVGRNEVPSENDFARNNPYAPPDYDANFKVNDLAVSYDNDTVRILGKSGTAYKALVINRPVGGAFWYRATSLYPYYDRQEFQNIISDYRYILENFLHCYGTKHNLPREMMEGREDLPYSSVEAFKKELNEIMPKLAQIETRLKTLQSQPNNFMVAEDNPGIWMEIASQRDQYAQCALNKVQTQVLQEKLHFFTLFIDEAQKEVEAFYPGKTYFGGADTMDYVLLAVSRRARDRWLTEKGGLDVRQEIDRRLDELAAATAKKLPLYTPDAGFFQYRDPAAEKLLMGYLAKNPSPVKILRVGLQSANWLVQKDKYDLLPTYHYKDAYVYFRDPQDDHPYCQLVSIRVKQDYAGGGRYSAQTYYGNSSRQLIGCPAGAQ